MDVNTISQAAGVGLDIATAIGNIGSARRQHKRTKFFAVIILLVI